MVLDLNQKKERKNAAFLCNCWSVLRENKKEDESAEKELSRKDKTGKNKKHVFLLVCGCTCFASSYLNVLLGGCKFVKANDEIAFRDVEAFLQRCRAMDKSSEDQDKNPSLLSLLLFFFIY